MRTLLKGMLFTFFIAGAGSLFAGPVNINTADEETLEAELEGVGPALAAAIVRDREENGRYESVEALTRVRGIGQRVIEVNKDFILIADEESGSE